MRELQAVTQSPKVVHLNTTESAAGRSATAIPPILHTVRQTAKKRLAELVQTLFNHTDDALFEMADRSRNDADQHLYFDSMREIRLHRKEVMTQFGDEIYQGFAKLFAPAGARSSESPDEGEELSLLRNDELEVAVAVAGIVSKVTSQYSLPIMQLTRRIDHLCQAQTVTEKSNPLGPQRLAHVFVEAASGLNLDIRVRIVLLKLFERHVMEHLGPTYDEANRLLAEAGVLTDLKSVLRRESTRESTRPAARAGAAAPTPDALPGADLTAEPSFDALQRLLAATRLSGTGGGAHPGTGGHGAPGVGGSGGGGGGAFAGPLISTQDLMSVLASVQTDASSAPIDLDAVPAVIDFRSLLLSRAVGEGGAKPGGMARADEDTVNLVGMLFDYILNDRNLAIPMKALIGRLQIPVLRIAVQDKTFFSKSSHPARQLLNELSSAGIGWSSSAELKRDALYNLIESVVLRVMNDFSEDPALLEKLVEELRQFVRRDGSRVQIVEQRVKESESGRAKSIAAKQTVEKLVNQKASGLRLPADVGRFISDTWSRVLVYICVRHGTDGSEWTDAVGALDDLLWSVQPLERIEDVERRENLIDEIVDRLERGMLLVSTDDSDIEAQLSTLRARIREINDSDRSFLQDDTREHALPDLPLMEEIVLASPDDRAALEDPDPAPEMVREINRLTEGVWVEMTGENRERLRCKLATIVQPGNRYIFVNRRGMKVAEKNRMALAIELKRKTLSVLEESQVFDRALEAVIGNLRQLHKRATTGA
jgi:uncharacterized protein YheU (UPF0270 family)